MSSRTSNLSLYKPTLGDSSESWGSLLNSNADIIDAWSEEVLTTSSPIASSSIAFSGNLDLSGQSIVDVGTLNFTSGGSITSAGDNFTFTTVSGAPAILHAGLRDRPSITDYLTNRTVREAVDAAHVELAADSGGTLLFPSRHSSSSFDVDNTGLGPIDWTNDGVWWEGDSGTGSIIRNISTDGTDFISFDGQGNAIQRCGFKNLKIDSLATAGHIWTFAGDAGISYSRWENLWVIQRALSSAIMIGSFGSNGGTFENTFSEGIYEHGTGSTVPLVSAFDLRGSANDISVNKWLGPIRFHCHFSLAPFFRIECTSGASGPFQHQNEWRGVNVEAARRGFILIGGCHAPIIDDITFYDSTNVDGNLIETFTGSGGKACEGIFIDRIKGSGDMVGVAGTEVTVTSLTQAGGLATLDATAHGLTDGMVAYITGATPAGYNGRFVVDRITANQFTYPVDAGLSSPATGTITTASGSMHIKLDTGAAGAMISRCSRIGQSYPVEIDLNSNDATYVGSLHDVNLYRVSDTLSSIMGGGGSTDARVETPKVYTNAIEERTAGAGITVSGAVTFEEGVAAQEGVTFGSGGTISFVTKEVQSITPGTIPAGSSVNFWVTVAGIESGDRVSVNPNSLPEEGLTWCGFATTSGSAVIRIANVTGSPIIAGGRNWLIGVVRQ